MRSTGDCARSRCGSPPAGRTPPRPGGPPGPEAAVGGWSAAPAPGRLPGRAVEPLSVKGFHDQTVRMMVHTSVGGDRARVRLSNRFGAKPLTVGHVTLALPFPDAGAGDLKPNSIHELTFSGQRSV